MIKLVPFYLYVFTKDTLEKKTIFLQTKTRTQYCKMFNFSKDLEVVMGVSI